MVCEHLKELEDELVSAGVRETSRGQVWSENCREWVYFDCCLELPSLRERFGFESCVVDHELLGCHEGEELGLVCSVCHDAIMGLPGRHRDRGVRVFR